MRRRKVAGGGADEERRPPAGGPGRVAVRFHVGGIFSKLGVTTRPEAIALAYRHHLVEGARG